MADPADDSLPGQLQQLALEACVWPTMIRSANR